MCVEQTTDDLAVTSPLEGNSNSGQTPRRSFLGMLLGVGAAGVGALLFVPLIRFAMHPLLRATTPISWSPVGKVEEFASITAPVKRLVTIEQRDGWRKIVSEKPVYVVKTDKGELEILSAVCTHLGCSIPWNEGKGEFVCPCHHASFAPDGKLRGGPAPRSMDWLESRIDGGVLNVRYQYFRQLVRSKEVIA
jgi:menaquinol-cytochrome c reductase iron-sulfur subunit